MENEYDALEKLTLLVPHAVDWRHIPSDWHRLRPEDIAAKLAKVSRGASLLCRYKYIGQQEVYRDLVHWLKVEIYGTLITKAQPIHSLMVEAAINEVCNPKICKACRGVGYVPEFGSDGNPTGRPAPCPQSENPEHHCVGGRVPWTEYARSQAIGVSRESFRRNHSRLYLEILTIPWTWEGEVRDQLNH